MIKSSMIIHPDELSIRWIDKLAKAKITTLGIHPRGGAEAKQALEELVDQMKTPAYRKIIDYAKSKGLEIEYEMHTASYLLPRELYDEHPEYFRVNANGERTNDYNFCVSSPEVLEIIADRALNLALSLYGSSDNFYFWLDDGHDFKCHCEKCKNLSASDQQLIVLNAIQNKLKSKLPNARVAYLAYMDTIVTPRAITPEKGIFLEYAPFEKYTAKGENASVLIEQERKMLMPLSRFFDNEPKKVLEYWYDNSMFSSWKKPPKKFTLDEEVMRKDISDYKKAGFESIATFACYLGDDYVSLYGDVDVQPFASVLTL